ncbi:MAG: hypothetical protein GY835_20810 [bacterium]|nr:hypothetical protein [bacterium]
MLLLFCGVACGERDSPQSGSSTLPAGLEMYITGSRGGEKIPIPAADPRIPQLLAEVEKIVAAAQRQDRQVSRTKFRRACARGALEIRFSRAYPFAGADGDSLRVWRLMIPFGVEMDPRQKRVCLFTGHPGWDTTPWFSTRGREHLLTILENPGDDR